MRLSLIALLAFACTPAEPDPNPEPGESMLEPTFPGAEWETAEPEQVGLSSEAVDALLDKVFEHSVTQGAVIIRNGYVVGERYVAGKDVESPATSWSVAKSFYASAMGAAIEDGLVGSYDDLVVTYIPEWDGTDKAPMTIRNLLEMRSGLYNSEEIFEPDLNEYGMNLELTGTIDSTFDYNNFNSQLFGEILQRVSQQTATEYLTSRLLDPIGFQESRYWQDKSNNSLTFAGIDAETREFARFGYLIASEGSWDGQVLLTPETITEMTSAGSDTFYGLHWWTVSPSLASLLAQLSGEATPEIELSLEVPVALGANGQFIIPWAEEDIVLAINTSYLQPPGDNNVFSMTNFPITRPAGDALYNDLFDYVYLMEQLPE